MLSTKISGLAIDTEYTFHLVLRTTAGTFNSQKLVCRTHKMTDLSGITVTPGVLPANLKDSLAEAVKRIGGKMIDTVRIDTTHFVCTEGRGPAWEKAVEMNIPVVRPEWVEGCEREGTIVSVRGYYLNADPKLRQIGPGVGANQNRDSAVLNSSASRPSTQRQNVPPNINVSTEGKDLPAPPITPFPGANPQTEESSETPPAPPPKDTENGTRSPDEKDEKQTEPERGEDEKPSADTTEREEYDEPTTPFPKFTEELDEIQREEQEETPKASANLEKVPSTDRSLPQFRQEGPQKTNGNGTSGEGSMEEVPL